MNGIGLAPRASPSQILGYFVDQGVRFPSFRRHGEDRRGLHDDDQGAIFERDFKAGVSVTARLRMIFATRVESQFDLITRGGALAWKMTFAAVDAHAAMIEQPDDLGARPAAQALDDAIDPLANVGRLRGDSQLFMNRRHVTSVSMETMNDDRLQLGHFVDRVPRTLFAESALLESAVGNQIRAPCGAPIDVQIAAVDFAREA